MAKLKWTPTKLIRRPDCIISSEARANGNTGFQPSYDKGRPHFPFLISNEYMRKWFKEREIYTKDVYASLLTEKESTSLRRRYVLRDMTKKKYNKMLDYSRKTRNQNLVTIKKGVVLRKKKKQTDNEK